MEKEIHYRPQFLKEEYHCPHCQVYADQWWSSLYANQFKKDLESKWTVSQCRHCGELAFWLDKAMIFPKLIVAAKPNTDMDMEIQNDYIEAAKIFNDSPRASAALLRLALQKLCVQLGEKGKNINDDIGELVKKGLNPSIQKALDSLRIVGNNGAHPGEINLNEEPERVLKLFELLNFIAEKMITEPKEVNSFYSNLPTEAKEAVIRRDQKDT